MDDNALWQELTSVFSSVFGRSDFTLTPTTTAGDIAYWDSLNHVQLILAVERHFQIRFKHAQVASFENVGDLYAAVKSTLEKKTA